MLPRLLKIRAVAGTIEGDLALLAAALRANAPVDGRTKAFFFANLADGAAQTEDSPSSALCTERLEDGSAEQPEATRPAFHSATGNPSGTYVWAISGRLPVNSHVIMPISACNLCGTRVK